MRHTITCALVLGWLAVPHAVEAAGDPCATSRRLAMLEKAYRLMLQSPGTPESAETAFYAGVIARSVAMDAPPGTGEALIDLGQLASALHAAGGTFVLGPEDRTRHLANITRIGSVLRAGDCPEPRIDASLPDAHPDTDTEGDGTAEKSALSGFGKRGDRVQHPVASFALHEADWMQDVSVTDYLRAAFVTVGILALAGVVWLMRGAALVLLVGLSRSRPELGANKSWHVRLIARIARNRRKMQHHVLGRFFDVVPSGTEIRKRMKVADISVGGAKLAWTDPPPTGTRFHINLDGIGRDGEIIWVNPHFCGVEFDALLTDSELRMILVKPSEAPEASGELEMF